MLLVKVVVYKGSTWMWSKSKARILHCKILVRNPKIHGWIFGFHIFGSAIEKFFEFSAFLSLFLL